MRQVIAFIKAHKVDDVTLALHGLDALPGLSVSHVRGFGHGWRRPDDAERAGEVDDLHDTARLEVFCANTLADAVVDTIERHAHTGLRGDGNIYVCEVRESVRISTGERGEAER